MLHKYFRCFYISLLGLITPTYVLADPVTGNISADVTWTASGNPWVITSQDINNPIEEITIGAAYTLTIEPGVVVQVDGPLSIKVAGTLVARGTADNPITFQALSPGGQWRTLEFAPTSTDATFNNGNYQSGSILEYVNFESGGGLSYAKLPANGSVFLNAARPYINQVTIRDGDASGVYAFEIDGLLKIDNTSIINNHDTSLDKAGGITVRNQLATGADIQVSDSTITDNSTSSILGGGGILVENIGALTVSGNTINDNVSATLGGGIALFDLTGAQANYLVEGNTISGNIADVDGGGISLDNATAIVRNNTVRDNSSTTGHGGGISVGANADAFIEGNVFVNNDAGGNGGGIQVESNVASMLAIHANVISGNSSIDGAGGLYVKKDNISIVGNMIAENTTSAFTSAVEVYAGGSFQNNMVTRHQSDSIVAINQSIDLVTPVALSVSNNNLSQNDAGLYVVVNNAMTLPTVTANNILDNGLGYYLGNTVLTAGDMTATNNYFGITDPVLLAANIDLLVAFDPFALTMFTDPVPISPPTNVTMTRSGSSVTLTWSASSETDASGYKVYWGNSQAPFYEQQMDVGAVTSHTITGLSSSQTWYFAVTAYDLDIGTVSDDPATVINEAQTSGHESWFSEEFMVAATPASSGDDSGGGSMGWLMLLLIPVYLRRQRQAATACSALSIK